MWIYKNKEFTIDDIPENAFGFVYLMIVVIDGIQYGYIGKKQLYANKKTKIGVRERTQMLAENPRSRKTKKIVVKLNPIWKYYSSNATLIEAHAKGIPIKRYILEICYSNRALTYKEMVYQVKANVLENDHYLNDHILGKFYKHGVNTVVS